jgi:hypothetical protein
MRDYSGKGIYWSDQMVYGEALSTGRGAGSVDNFHDPLTDNAGVGDKVGAQAGRRGIFRTEPGMLHVVNPMHGVRRNSTIMIGPIIVKRCEP